MSVDVRNLKDPNQKTGLNLIEHGMSMVAGWPHRHLDLISYDDFNEVKLHFDPRDFKDIFDDKQRKANEKAFVFQRLRDELQDKNKWLDVVKTNSDGSCMILYQDKILVRVFCGLEVPPHGDSWFFHFTDETFGSKLIDQVLDSAKLYVKGMEQISREFDKKGTNDQTTQKK